MIKSKTYKKIVRREGMAIVDVLNTTDKNKRKEIIKQEVDDRKNEFEKDILKEIKTIAKYRLIEDD